MAPRNEHDTMKEISGASDFFKTIDPRGYPAVQVKERPWMKLLAARQDKGSNAESNEKLIVLCSTTHDYGSSSVGGH